MKETFQQRVQLYLQGCPLINLMTIVLVMGIPYTFQITTYAKVLRRTGVSSSAEVARSNKLYLSLAKHRVVFRSHRQVLKLLDD